MTPLLEITDAGLYCPPGDFHIDPWAPVERAVLTHAHSDHAHPECRRYLAQRDGAALLRRRLGSEATLDLLAYGEPCKINGLEISFHPAGHILGSAQVRIEYEGEVVVLSGDYKREPDVTCAPFEPLPCDTFVTEATFALPIYRWRPQAEIFDEINAWWRRNREIERTSILFAYALGKAQRVLAGLDPQIGPIAAHGAVRLYLQPYLEAGVRLPPVGPATPEEAARLRGRGLILAPPSASGSPWLRKWGAVSTGFVSGWMQVRGTRRRRNVDRGFVLSDHADWDGLLDTVRATGAESIGVTHGYSLPLARYLREQGYNAMVYPTRFSDAEEELPEDTDMDTN